MDGFSPYSHLGWNPTFRPPSGYNIPMLGENQQAVDEEPENFEEPDFEESPDGMDWNLISKCSPESIVENNDVDRLEEIVKAFTKAKFSSADSKIIPNPLGQKLLRLLQISITYLLDCQKQLQQELHLADAREDTANAKVSKYSTVIKELKGKLNQNNEVEKCIVCGKRYKNIAYLDSHMERRHNALLPAWKSLRCGEIHGLKDIIGELENLRNVIAQTRKEAAILRRQKKEEPKEMKLPPEQIELINQLKNNQQVLIERTKQRNNEQDQMQAEIRQQLDEAVAALKKSHEKWLSSTMEREPKYNIIINQPSSLMNNANNNSQSNFLNSSAQKDTVVQDLNYLLNSVKIPDKENLPSKQPKLEEQSINDESLTLKQMIKRMDEHADLVNTIEPPPPDTQPPPRVVFLPGERIKVKAKQFVERETEIDEAVRDLKMPSYKKQVNEELTKTLEELKKGRAVPQLSIPYVRSKLQEDTNVYIALFDKLLFEVRRSAPIDEIDRSKLFCDREVKFPLVPPIEENVKGKQTYQIAKERPVEPAPVSQEAINAARKKLPYEQRIRPNRANLLPDDSDIETVSMKEEESAHSIGFTDDPYMFGRKKKPQDVLEISLSSSSTSSKKKKVEKSSSEKIDFGSPVSSEDEKSMSEKSDKPVKNVISASTADLQELNDPVLEMLKSSDSEPPSPKPTKSTVVTSKVNLAESDKSKTKGEDLFGTSVSEVGSSSTIHSDDDF